MNPKIQIFNFWKSFVWFSPERGGLITNLNINWDEILFLNKETFYDLEKNVRWWIPIMFPNSWPIFDKNIFNLNQHWFARNSIFDSEIIENKLILTLKSNSDTKKLYDFDFEFKAIVEFIENWFKISQVIKNNSTINLPIASWFHPYFHIKNEDKVKIKFKNFSDNFFNIWSIWDTKYLDNISVLEVDFQKYILEFNYDKEFKQIWLWSEKEKDFLCIEPVLRKENWLIDNPVLILPWETKTYSFNIIKK